MPTSELVSIVTPCYNAAPFVQETIESVAAQSHPAVEHVVVDDASNDGSDRVIARYAERLRTVRLERNQGGSHARNRGAALARGAYLLFLDADDVLTPGAVAALVAAARARPGAIAVGAWQRLQRSPDGRWLPQPAEVRFPPPRDALRGWLEGVWVPPCAVLWPRDVYEDTGGWDEAITYNDDGDLMMRALARGTSLAPTGGGPEIIALYRAHGDGRLSVSRNLFSERPLLSQLRVLDKLAEELEARARLATYADALGLAYHKLALTAFQQEHIELGRECARRGEQYAGPRLVSRTSAGRMLAAVLGVERKERIVTALARHGVMTPQRRRYVHLRRLADASPQAPGAPAGEDAAELRVVAWPERRPENPYTRLLYDEMRGLGVEVRDFSISRLARAAIGRRPVVWHLHWPERMLGRRSVPAAFARTAALLTLARAARACGVTLVWTAHNLRSHEGYHSRLERWFWRAFIPQLDGFLALTEQGRAAARDTFPKLRDVPSAVVPHGHYRDAYPAPLTRDEARSWFQMPAHAHVVAFVGQLRPYKGVPDLARVFLECAGSTDLLLIAGEPDSPATLSAIATAADGDPRVLVVPRFLPDEELHVYLRAADLVVLPFRDVQNSGSALLALSFDRPVLVPRRGAMAELQEVVGAEWVQTYEDELTPETLAKAMRWAYGVRGDPCRPLDALGWTGIARDTLDLYRAARAARRSRGAGVTR